jgi:phosphoribosyl 1,2-cyclic phosphate phosphodiesterase
LTIDFTILGSGTSTGVPVLGCSCRVCRSKDPKDRRSRASLWVEAGGLSILFDTATEFRLQALAAGIGSLDALFVTHAHADHIHGLDDLRTLSHHGEIPLYSSPSTLEEIENRFSYIFRGLRTGGGKPRIRLSPVYAEGEPVRLPGPEGELSVLPVPIFHGSMPILGYRIGPFAYLTDCSEIPQKSYRLLEGVQVLVVDGLRFRPHPTHFSVDQAIAAVRRIGAQEAYLTHLCHEVSYRELAEYLPDGIHPAFDGLKGRVETD